MTRKEVKRFQIFLKEAQESSRNVGYCHMYIYPDKHKPLGVTYQTWDKAGYCSNVKELSRLLERQPEGMSKFLLKNVASIDMWTYAGWSGNRHANVRYF